MASPMWKQALDNFELIAEEAEETENPASIDTQLDEVFKRLVAAAKAGRISISNQGFEDWMASAGDITDPILASMWDEIAALKYDLRFEPLPPKRRAYKEQRLQRLEAASEDIVSTLSFGFAGIEKALKSRLRMYR